jgi:hypothetical protein
VTAAGTRDLQAADTDLSGTDDGEELVAGEVG